MHSKNRANRSSHYNRQPPGRYKGTTSNQHHSAGTHGRQRPFAGTDPLGHAKSKTSQRGHRHSLIVPADVGGQSVLSRPEQLTVDPQTCIQTQMNPENVSAACFQQDGVYWDQEIVPSSNVHYANKVTLQLELLNDSTAAMHLGPFWQLFDKIEILPDGSDVAQTLYSDQLFFLSHLKWSDEQRAMESENYGVNRDTNRNSAVSPYDLLNYDAAGNGAGIIVAPQGRYTYFVEIPSILENCDLFLPALTNWPRFRFYPSFKNNQMKSSPALLLPTPAQPKILRALFVVSGPQLPDVILKQSIDLHSSIPSVSIGIMTDRQIISINPVSGVEGGDYVLNSTTGKIAGFIAFARPVGAIREEQFSPGTAQTWRLIDTFTFKYSDGQTMSYEKQPFQLFRTKRWMENWCHNNLAFEKSFLWYSFCSDPMAAITDGVDTGSHIFNAKESMRFTFVSTAAGGNTFVDNSPHELLIYPFRFGQVTLCGGVLTAEKLS